MKKVAFICMLGFALAIFPLFSASTNVKGYRGLFDISYPFTLAKGHAGFTLGINNIDLKTADVDVNRFFLGIGVGVVENLELNLNVSYNRVHMLEPGATNVEYPFADRWQTGLGYASFGVKYSFTGDKDTAFGVLGYFDLPLSDEEAAVTTSKSKFGVDFLFAHKLSQKALVSLNAGYQVNQEPDKVDIANAITYAAGIEVGIGENLSFASQLAGKVYSGTDLEQDSPLNLIIGFKFEKDDQFGFAVGYKKNILFNDKSLGDSHGGIGTLWINTKPKPKAGPCTAIETVAIKGDNQAKVGEQRSYQAVLSPDTATKPITYAWSVSANGVIESGQGSPTVGVKWTKEMANAWVKVAASNQCSNVNSTLSLKVMIPVLPAKEEYFFAFDSSELSPAAMKDLDKAVEYFKYHPNTQIDIQGHTCSIATEQYNLALGEHRAEAIKKYLIEKGVSPDRIKSISYGEEKPAYDNSAETTRKKNRRVFIPGNKK